MSNLRRSMMMAGRGGSEDIYANMVTLEFTLSQSYTGSITTSHSNVSLIDKIIIDGVDIGSITTSMSHTFDVGRHKIGWQMKDVTAIAQNTIPNFAPSGSLPSNNVTTIPSCVGTLGNYAMRGMPAYDNSYFIVCPTTPPTCGTLALGLWQASVNRPIYVPDDSIELYKSASQWSDYSAAFKPMSQLP